MSPRARLSPACIAGCCPKFRLEAHRADARIGRVQRLEHRNVPSVEAVVYVHDLERPAELLERSESAPVQLRERARLVEEGDDDRELRRHVLTGASVGAANDSAFDIRAGAYRFPGGGLHSRRGLARGRSDRAPEVWHGSPWMATSVIVVADEPELLATYLPEGAQFAFANGHDWPHPGPGGRLAGHGCSCCSGPGGLRRVALLGRPARDFAAGT